MYRKQSKPKTSIRINNTIEGETIEQKIERIVNNKEPITDGAPRIYQERSAGVEPGYNIRTDRFEVAVDAMDHVSKTYSAKREERIKAMKEMKEGKENDGKAESTQGQAKSPSGDQTT